MSATAERSLDPRVKEFTARRCSSMGMPAANDTIYGLGSGIWTKDLSRAQRMAAQLHAGTVGVTCYNVFDAALPFGGYKQPGWGREMGLEVLSLYTQIKSACIRL